LIHVRLLLRVWEGLKSVEAHPKISPFIQKAKRLLNAVRRVALHSLLVVWWISGFADF
jgi:hypothetical protein